MNYYYYNNRRDCVEEYRVGIKSYKNIFIFLHKFFGYNLLLAV